MARALRIGQDHQVTIIRFITANTIEHVIIFIRGVLHSDLQPQQSSVLNRQKTKTRLAGGGFGSEKVKDSLVSLAYLI
jgi:SWI/SNF-related matrix-associated actin-dependent regulator of chromatin subfamily A3